MSRSVTRRALPALIAGLVLAVAVPLAWMGATPITHACDDTWLGTDELADTRSETSLWPPGVRCTARSQDGTEREASYVAWYELTVAILCGIGVWLAVAAILGVIAPRQLMRGGVAIVATLLVSTLGFFL